MSYLDDLHAANIPAPAAGYIFTTVLNYLSGDLSRDEVVVAMHEFGSAFQGWAPSGVTGKSAEVLALAVESAAISLPLIRDVHPKITERSKLYRGMMGMAAYLAKRA